MTPLLLRGADAAADVYAQLEADLSRMPFRAAPRLVALRDPEDQDTGRYVESQRKACGRLGLRFEAADLPATQRDLLAAVAALNADPSVTGVFLQSPLPPPFDLGAARSALDPAKDAERAGPAALGMLVLGEWAVGPCTALAAVKLVRRACKELKTGFAGKRAVVVGRSAAVGKAAALLLLNQPDRPTVSVCHSQTADLPAETARADILVVAAGVPELIGPDGVKEGAIVIDVGFTMRDGRAVGDVRFGEVAPKCAAITPVPGGVGPLTVASLMWNVVQLAAAAKGPAEGGTA